MIAITGNGGEINNKRQYTTHKYMLIMRFRG